MAGSISTTTEDMAGIDSMVTVAIDDEAVVLGKGPSAVLNAHVSVSSVSRDRVNLTPRT